MSEQIHENKMGVMPVKRLIISMSLPMMISMLVQALYNIVDSLFVAQISEDALTAVTLAFPMQNLMIAVATGTGVGINALLSRALGARELDDANKAANNGILLMAASSILFVMIGFFLTGPFVSTQTDSPFIAEYAEEYISIVTICSIGLFFQMAFERLLQSTGKTLLSMISQITGAVINMILDPVMIFGWFGLPAMGVTGAAIATCIGQCCAAVVAFILNVKFNKEIRLSMSEVFSLSGSIIRKIYNVGVPSIFMVSIGSIMTYGMNIILGGFSSTAQAVFGVYFRLQSFFFMPVFGLNNGLIPVIAFNYGARKKARILEALRFSVVLAFVVMCTGTLVLEIFPKLLLMMFDASDVMIELGVPALRIIGLHFPMAAIAIALISVFQALAKSYYSLIVSLARQLVVLLPAAWLLSLTGVVGNVWWSFVIAEVISLIVTLFFYTRIKRKMIDVM